jgi:hypothetical protein
VPHLEALLLLRAEPNAGWDAKRMARRLYIPEGKAAILLGSLCASGFAEEEKGRHVYRYAPASPEIGDILNRLAHIYGQSLIEVTKLIHSKTGKQAQTFGDAFKWPGGGEA